MCACAGNVYNSTWTNVCIYRAICIASKWPLVSVTFAFFPFRFRVKRAKRAQKQSNFLRFPLQFILSTAHVDGVAWDASQKRCEPSLLFHLFRRSAKGWMIKENWLSWILYYLFSPFSEMRVIKWMVCVCKYTNGWHIQDQVANAASFMNFLIEFWRNHCTRSLFTMLNILFRIWVN